MSLASRVSSFISGQRGDRNDLGFADDGGRGSFGDRTLGVVSEIMAQETVEEEARPPYLHVRDLRYNLMESADENSL